MAKRKKWLCVFSKIILAAAVLSAIGFLFIWNSEKIDTSRLDVISHPLVFYADDGTLIEGTKTPRYCPLYEISQNCINAFIAVEDKNFYSHNGISFPRIAKAILANIKAGYSKEGASTITQQLVKNTHLTNEKTIRRKLREAILALKLEKKYSKDQILELYLNAIYFGNNIYGIENAAEFYFSRSPKTLTAAQGAALAALVQAPKKFDPLTQRSNFLTRTKLILTLMRDQGYLTDSEYNTAFTETEDIKIQSNENAIGFLYQLSALAEAAKILDLSETDIASYGYQIETYFDKSKQNLIYKIMNEPEYEIKTISKSQPDKFIMLSKPSGAVSALWASTPALLSARRNFGSAVKPLLVYMPALEFGMITPDSKINDSPITAGDFRPQNIGGKYYGTVSVREAVTKSLNIPAIKIMDMTGVENACSVAKKLGLSLGDENLSAALGNTSLGISFLELSGAYQTAANGGKSATPRFIKSIKDRNGKIVYQDTSGKYNYAPTAVSENTAYLMTDMLLDVTRFGTGKKLSYLGIDIASKTGTTQRDSADTNTDITFVSYTPNDVLIAWKGNADMKPQNDLPKGTLGGASLGFTVREIHKHISDKNVHFKKPASIIAKEATASLLSTALAVDGKTENNDTSQIWFDTKSNQTYEIYKNDVLQEVITGKNERHYFKDKNPSKKNVYKVISLDNDNKIQSSEIVLPWYF